MGRLGQFSVPMLVMLVAVTLTGVSAYVSVISQDTYVRNQPTQLAIRTMDLEALSAEKNMVTPAFPFSFEAAVKEVAENGGFWGEVSDSRQWSVWTDLSSGFTPPIIDGHNYLENTEYTERFGRAKTALEAQGKEDLAKFTRNYAPEKPETVMTFDVDRFAINPTDTDTYALLEMNIVAQDGFTGTQVTNKVELEETLLPRYKLLFDAALKIYDQLESQHFDDYPDRGFMQDSATSVDRWVNEYCTGDCQGSIRIIETQRTERYKYGSRKISYTMSDYSDVGKSCVYGSKTYWMESAVYEYVVDTYEITLKDRNDLLPSGRPLEFRFRMDVMHLEKIGQCLEDRDCDTTGVGWVGRECCVDQTEFQSCQSLLEGGVSCTSYCYDSDARINKESKLICKSNKCYVRSRTYRDCRCS